MITFPNCKINLGLWVTQRRTDGYHNLQTIMFPVPWCDALEIIPLEGGETVLTITGNKVESSLQDNLCFRAWKLLANEFNIKPVRMHLHKVIPTGAGLGGGSADAAFTLQMLNSMFNLNLDNHALRGYAVRLGMDCPFFIENVPALSTGRGEFLKPLILSLEGLYLIIVKPPVHVSTAAAFAGIKPYMRENAIEELITLPVGEWKQVLKNDFEETVFDLYPDIEEIKNTLYRSGAIYAALSGSGSAVYGLFSNNPSALNFTGCQVFHALLGSHPK